MIDKKKQGKKNKASGQRFELKVRKDLESKGWIVSKWMNNVELPKLEEVQAIHVGHNKWIKRLEPTKGSLVPAKHKFRGPGIPMAIGTGFPDFIAFERINGSSLQHPFKIYTVIGVEVKSNGYLDKIEKEKCKWLLDNNIFSKILIASKSKERGKINYKPFSFLIGKKR